MLDEIDVALDNVIIIKVRKFIVHVIVATWAQVICRDEPILPAKFLEK